MAGQGGRQSELKSCAIPTPSVPGQGSGFLLEPLGEVLFGPEPLRGRGGGMSVRGGETRGAGHSQEVESNSRDWDRLRERDRDGGEGGAQRETETERPRERQKGK